MTKFINQLISTAAIKYLGKMVVLASTIFFTRAMTIEDFGAYSYVISVITIATIPVVAGVPNLIIRETARYKNEEKFGHINGLKSWSSKYILFVGSLSSIIIYASNEVGLINIEISLLILIAITISIFKGLLNQQSALINGFGYPQYSQISLHFILPLITLVSSLMVYGIYGTLNSVNLITALLISVVITLMISSYIFKNKCGFRDEMKKFESKKWRSAVLPLSMIGIVGTLNTELASFILGGSVNNKELALFKVAMQTVLIIKLALTSVNVIIGPKIAKSYNLDNIRETQNVLRNSVRISCLISFPFFILLVLFGDYVIELLYGSKYSSVTDILNILIVGQVINVSVGSVNLVLNMIGQEKIALKVMLVTFTLTLGLMLLLIPAYGAIGAAYSSSLSLLIWNLSMMLIVYKKTKLKSWLH